MIYITPLIKINEKEIKLDFVRASGPGGQNINKVATAVHLRFDVKNASFLSDAVRNRLMSMAGKKITEDGTLIIQAKRFRTQERNRQDAMERLIRLIRKAADEPKSRIKTKPTGASKQRLLAAKRHRSYIKRMRRSISDSDD